MSQYSLAEKRKQFDAQFPVGLVVPASRLLSIEGCFPLERIESNIIVLTGANSCGKSSLLKILQKDNYECIPEFLRDIYDDSENFFGIHKIGKQCSDLVVRKALADHLEYLSKVDPDQNQLIFSDRGLGDFLGFFRFIQTLTSPVFRFKLSQKLIKDEDIREVFRQDVPLTEVSQLCSQQIQLALQFGSKIRYKKVLQLNPLPKYEKDGRRPDDKFVARLMHLYVRKAWKDLGYQIESIPACLDDLEGRKQLVLESS
jgi:predicted ATPase